MKKWLVRIFIGLILTFAAIVAGVLTLENLDETMPVKFVKNESLPTVRADWEGTPVDAKGRFVNAEFPFLPKMTDLLKWKFGDAPFAEEKKTDAERLEVLDPTEFLNGEKDGILWLGHASVYVRLNGKGFLIDPVFGEHRFVKRFVEVTNQLEKLKKVDYVLLTHDHRDHADADTIQAVTRKFPNAKLLGGLRMEDLFDAWKTPTNEVQTAGWYQSFKTDGDLKVTFVPTRHWCRRSLFDTNYRLWGGFVIEGNGVKIYHGGDSGYGSHYKELAETFGGIDYFVIGIGAYEPRWFMKANHNNPSDALQGFLDANGKTLVPMHYQTFDLSDEPPSQPLRLLKEEAAKKDVSENIKALRINESVEF